MLDQAELQDRLLSLLEEAGEENIPTLANTICNRFDDVDEARLAIKAALIALIEQDLVRVAFDHGTASRLVETSKSRSREVTDCLTDHLLLREDGKSWTGGAEPWPEIVTTQLGKSRGRAILDARGYLWWRR